jgi:hypothetical protein
MSILDKYSIGQEAIASDCMTPDANYKTKVSDGYVSVYVKIPDNVEFAELDEKESIQLEKNLHNAVELVLAPYFK